MPVFFADTFAIPASGVVAVQEYGSSPRHRARSVSTKTTGILRQRLGACMLTLGLSLPLAPWLARSLALALAPSLGLSWLDGCCPVTSLVRPQIAP
jgi:hypothetical protein